MTRKAQVSKPKFRKGEVVRLLGFPFEVYARIILNPRWSKSDGEWEYKFNPHEFWLPWKGESTMRKQTAKERGQ